MTSTSFLDGGISGDVSTCNISDAMNRGGSLGAFRILSPPAKAIFGKAVTCETRNGDWKAVVQAIDAAGPDDIVVVSTLEGREIAVMGELLANSAKLRKIRAMVIDGAVRDLPELLELDFPIYARSFVPNAGDPLGKGEIQKDITVNGVRIAPGDVVVCDGSGVVCIPASMADDVISKAEAVVDKEGSIRKQILEGKRLSDILNF